ncbi:MAG: DUF817 domain-containing protein [Microbacteriaceae bacterium]
MSQSPQRPLTSTEQGVDRLAHRLLARVPHRGPAAVLAELGVFAIKQAWAVLFGAAMLAVLLAARLWYPDGAPLARNDAITIAALVIQLLMLALRLETLGELRVVLTFHVVGTVMELFKTGIGSWEYPAGGVLRIGAVPLFSGFMYASVGSYLVRVFRLFELRFDRYPRIWLTAVLAALVYANFFSHHWIWDARYVLIVAVVALYLRCTMHFRVFRVRARMPILLAFALVTVFIWFAENIGTFARAWSYPAQAAAWHPVAPGKLGSWFLLMIISVVLVTWVHRPRPPEAADRGLATGRAP